MQRLKQKLKNKSVLLIHLLKYTGLISIGVIITFVVFNLHNSDLTMLPRIFVDRSFYNYVSVSYINDEYAENITRFCSGFEDEDQVECVVTNIVEKYNYELRNGTSIKKPIEFSQGTSLCRDIAVAYDIIFTKLNWRTDFNFYIPEHVYNEVWNNKIFCYIDGDKYTCY